MNSRIQNPISQEPVAIDRGVYQIQSNNVQGYSSTFSTFATQYQPIDAKPNQSMYCLLGNDECSPLCSGYTKNSCNLVAPIPGGPWQVQSASTVQNRLTNQDYTPAKCPMK